MDCWWRWGISLLSSLVDERRIPLDRFWRGVYSHKQPDRVYASDCVPNQHFHAHREYESATAARWHQFPVLSATANFHSHAACNLGGVFLLCRSFTDGFCALVEQLPFGLRHLRHDDSAHAIASQHAWK